MNIFVARLNPSVKEEDLINLFSSYGEVVSAKVIYDRNTGYSKCYGFVEMKNEEDGLNAIKELDGSMFEENEIVVKRAKSRKNLRRRRFRRDKE